MEASTQAILNAIDNFNAILTTFILMNPMDILELNMDDFTENIWFISNIELKPGEALVLKEDSSTKRELYHYFKDHPEKCWHGTKPLTIEEGV